MRLGAGEELYLIPGIDMINHSTRRQECNTALEQSSYGVIFQRAPDQPSEEYTGGLFVMKAGRISVHAGLVQSMSKFRLLSTDYWGAQQRCAGQG